VVLVRNITVRLLTAAQTQVGIGAVVIGNVRVAVVVTRLRGLVVCMRRFGARSRRI